MERCTALAPASEQGASPPPPPPRLWCQVAVADLSLAIPRCECFGLLGPNGAGGAAAAVPMSRRSQAQPPGSAVHRYCLGPHQCT